jgi:hypothetical protein
MYAPPVIWATSQLHDEDRRSTHVRQRTAWRRAWASKYHLLSPARQQQSQHYTYRGLNHIAGIQLVISSLVAQYERAKQQLAADREYCACVTIKYCGIDIPCPNKRVSVISAITQVTGSYRGGQEIHAAWNAYYETKKDVRAIHEEVSRLQLPGHSGAEGSWEDDTAYVQE